MERNEMMRALDLYCDKVPEAEAPIMYVVMSNGSEELLTMKDIRDAVKEAFGRVDELEKQISEEAVVEECNKE